MSRINGFLTEAQLDAMHHERMQHERGTQQKIAGAAPRRGWPEGKTAATIRTLSEAEGAYKNLRSDLDKFLRETRG